MKNMGLVLVSVALILAFRPDLLDVFQGENKPDANGRTAPERELRELVAPIRAIGLSRGDAERLVRFYHALADVIDRDVEGIIKTSAEVRLINERSGRLCFEKTGIAGRYPRLAEAIDIAIAHGVGGKRLDGKWESVEITHENRKGLVDALNAVAWACQRY